MSISRCTNCNAFIGVGTGYSKDTGLTWRYSPKLKKPTFFFKGERMKSVDSKSREFHKCSDCVKVNINGA